MKIEFKIELDTLEDTAIGEELMDLIVLLKERIENLNEEAEE